MSRVLIVDDEPQLLRALRINLAARGHDVRTASDGRHALADAAAHVPDVVILDLGLPDMDGVEVIRGLRGWTAVPIIVLSGRAGSGDKVEALDAGADDYVTKPFGVDELLARLRAVSRRAASDHDVPVVRVGAYTIDLAARRAVRSGGSTDTAGETSDAGGNSRDVRLTPTEWQILEILLRHPGKLVSQKLLLAEVWGRNTPTSSTTFANISPDSGASWNPTRRAPVICSPNPAWATDTSRERGTSRCRASTTRRPRCTWMRPCRRRWATASSVDCSVRR